MKKIVLSLIIVFVLMVSTTSVSADIGPKSSLDINVIGVDQPYIFDVFIYVDRQSFDYAIESELHLEDWLNDAYYLDAYPEVLNDYRDKDGFASRVIHNGPPSILRQSDDHSFNIRYFNAPDEFKAILLLEDGTIIHSEIANRRQFNSTFTWDLTGVDLSETRYDAGELSESIAVGRIGIEFLVRLGLTVLLELGVLALFFYRKIKSYKLVAITNLITQTGLTIGIMIGHYLFGFFSAVFLLFIGEIIVFTVEMIVYYSKLTEHSRVRALAYGFIANSISFFFTFVMLILGMFVLGAL